MTERRQHRWFLTRRAVDLLYVTDHQHPAPREEARAAGLAAFHPEGELPQDYRERFALDHDHPVHLEGQDNSPFASSESADGNGGGADHEHPPWTATSRGIETSLRHLVKGSTIEFVEGNIVPSLYRPFTAKYSYYAPIITHRRYQQPLIFPPAVASRNKVICFSGVASTKRFSVLATDRLYSLDLIEKTQCLPLYRYTEDGERVSNITQWGIDHINGHYRQEWGDDFQELAGEDGITAEEIFAYTYAVLHNPAYRHEYALDLLREFPRLPLYRDFHHWAEMGQKLLDLHIGFESAEPYPLERHDREGVDPKRAMLRADKSGGTITLDERTTLAGVPEKVWEYRLGNRSALEWLLDQYKGRKPRDPTIREKFNTYRFSNHKERVIDLLRRVCTVSVATMELVDGMGHWEGETCSSTATGP